MDRVTAIPAGCAAIVLLAAFLNGCPDPNSYGTPRTLTPGATQYQFALSGYVAGANGDAQGSPGLPSFGLRTGLVDRLDVGARLVDMTAVGADAKVNLVRGRIDLALDPMIQAFYGLPRATYVASVATLQFHVPLMLGINFNPTTALVLTPGFVASDATASASSVATNVSIDQIAFASRGIGGQMGIGLNVHESDTFSWQPEVTAWREFNSIDSWFCVFGIAVNVGAQPDYSDLAQ
jgi:hypothetical protein